MTASGGDKDFLVIAHRGASGYLPEHTLEAKAMAFGLGVGAIEQDVVLTKDDQLVVLHDIHLDTVSDVAERFPDRARENGRFYAIDFTLGEIRSLRAFERIHLETGEAVYSGRFPVGHSDFRIPSLAEEIELIQGLEKSTGRPMHIYVEYKAPAWHRKQGKDPARILLDVLDHYGYRTRQDRCFVQCFDANELERLRVEFGTDLKLVQLIGENSWGESPTDYDALTTPAGMKQVATFADGIGPHFSQLIRRNENTGSLELQPWGAAARKEGLFIHPYTFRADAYPEDSFPDFATFVREYVALTGIDGLFADHPDQVMRALDI